MATFTRSTRHLVRGATTKISQSEVNGSNVRRPIAVTSLQFARSTSTSSPTPKRPSPYRLIPLPTFLADFAPLHVQGWRLEHLPILPTGHQATPQDEGMAQLQDRRLVRRYDFEQGKAGWRRLMAFTQTAGEIVEKEDHHPTILISPAGDYRSTSGDTTIIGDTTGYVVHISTHTHTPLPPVKYPKASDGTQDTMRPGVTGKDLKLAVALEEIYQKSI